MLDIIDQWLPILAQRGAHAFDLEDGQALRGSFAIGLAVADSGDDGMAEAARDDQGLSALARMGARYHESLASRTALMLQLQGFAACGDPEVRELVRARVARMWDTVAGITGLDPVTVKSFLAFGMLLNNMAALDTGQVSEPWAEGVRTRIQAGLFEHINATTNQ